LRKGNLEGEYLLGLFNFTDERREITAPLDKVEKDIFFSIRDFQTGKHLGETKNIYVAKLCSHSCMLINLEEIR
jgi:hypothetical protein